MIVSKEGVGLMVSYTIKLIPSCVIYQAHFPGEPITPGVCIVQMAKELIEELLTEQTAVALHREQPPVLQWFFPLLTVQVSLSDR